VQVTALKTDRITAGSIELLKLLDDTISDMSEGSVLAITSKVVSLCEKNVVPFGQIDRETLIAQESDLYLPSTLSRYGHHFTITDQNLVSSAGIDESNGDNHFVLWPRDSQATANQVRAYLQQRFNLKQVGVIITDSTSLPFRRGASGMSLAHSGFAALVNYIGQPDLFGRPYKVSQADIVGGLAAAAVLVMGEGSEQTPLALLHDLPFVTFQASDPTPDDLAEAHVKLEDDLFAPFLTSVEWQKGKRQQS
jgi:putative folate metabolism gamma-glutamate ligase